MPGAIAEDPDTAVALNGSTSQVSVPASANLNVGDNFTIEAWVERRSVSRSDSPNMSTQEPSCFEAITSLE